MPVRIFGGHDIEGKKGYSWVSNDGVNFNSEPALPRAFSFGAASFKNDTFYLFGDVPSSADSTTLYSTDGKTWNTSVDQPHWMLVGTDVDSSVNSRAQFAYFFKDGKHIVVGGVKTNDIWTTTDPFVMWTHAGSFPLAARHTGHYDVQFNGKLWIVGGQWYSSSNLAGTRHNEIYSSLDGVNWTKEGNAPFTARTHGELIAFNNKLWYFGGFDGAYLNEIWSSVDGINWIQHTNASWSARIWMRVVSYQGKLFLYGGSNGSPLNDIWSSTDGENWSKETPVLPTSIYGHMAIAVEAPINQIDLTMTGTSISSGNLVLNVPNPVSITLNGTSISNGSLTFLAPSPITILAIGSSMSSGALILSVDNSVVIAMSGSSASLGVFILEVGAGNRLRSGFVYLSGNPIHGAVIRAYDVDGSPVYSTTSNADGSWTLNLSEDGEYTITCSYVAVDQKKYTSESKPFIVIGA